MNFFEFLEDKKYLLYVISLLINILFIGIIIILISNNFNYQKLNNKELKLTQNIQEEKPLSNNFYIDIKGEVKKPGVYEVNENNIINDIIKLAGGTTNKAYLNNVNLSKKVTPEMVIYIYNKDIIKKEKVPKIEKCICPTYDISRCIENKNSEIITDNKIKKTDNQNDQVNQQDSFNNEVEEVKLININNASIEELMSLSGIGESKAKEIIEYRNNNGLYKTIEEIKNVHGIGESIFEKIRTNITI